MTVEYLMALRGTNRRVWDTGMYITLKNQLPP